MRCIDCALGLASLGFRSPNHAGFSTALDDPGVRGEIVDRIVDALPLSDEQGRREVGHLLDGVARGAGSLGWVGALALLYSASGAIAALRHAVNEAWGTRDSRPYAQGKLLDVALVLMGAPIAVGALGLSLSGSVPAELDDEELIAGTLGVLLTGVLPVVLVFSLLVGIFRVLPAERAALRAAWPGALVATLGLMLVRLGVEAYLAAFSGKGSIYGTIGALLAICFAVYVQSIAVVLGAHVGGQVARLPSGVAIDEAIEAERGNGRPLGRFLLDALRGLFVRARPRRRS